MKKADLRKEMKQKRNLLPAELISWLEETLWESLKDHPIFKKSRVVYLYISCQNEVPTTRLLNECFKAGKMVAVPKVIDKENMEFYYITSTKQLMPGYQGILEPQDSCILAREPGIMFLPGVAFDRDNRRLGYGGGYYDRYISLHGRENYYKLGLAYDFQLLDKMDTESHDEEMNEVITVSVPSYR